MRRSRGKLADGNDLALSLVCVSLSKSCISAVSVVKRLFGFSVKSPLLGDSVGIFFDRARLCNFQKR